MIFIELLFGFFPPFVQVFILVSSILLFIIVLLKIIALILDVIPLL